MTIPRTGQNRKEAKQSTQVAPQKETWMKNMPVSLGQRSNAQWSTKISQGGNNFYQIAN